MSSNRRSPRLAISVTVAFAAGGTFAATDLASIQVVPTRGQSADQARRDRYECHNWAVEQTGNAPVRVDPAEVAAAERERNVERVLTGAGIGSTVGAVVAAGQADDPLASVVAGGVLGAAVAAITGRGKKKEGSDPAEEEYVRALSACLEGRGYEISIASEPKEE